MKKLLLLPIIALALVGCRTGSDQAETYYDKAHLISLGKCVEITDYRAANLEAYPTKIYLKDGSVLSGWSSEIILVRGTCPYCHAGE